MTGRIVPFPTPDKAPSLDELLTRVRALAADSENIHWDEPHVRNRMNERNVSMRQVLEVLRKGSVVSGPTLDEWGDWRIKLKRRVAGRRVQVAVAVKEKHLVVVTVI